MECLGYYVDSQIGGGSRTGGLRKAIKSCMEVQKRVENFLSTGNVQLG